MKILLLRYLRPLFLLICGTLILGQLGRIELSGGVALYFNDVLVSLFLLIFFVEKPKRLLHFIQTCELIQLSLVFNVWIILTSLVHFQGNPHQFLVAMLYLLRLDVLILFGRALFTLLKKQVLAVHEYGQALLSIPIGIAVLGFFQYFFYPDTRSLKYIGWDDHYFRLISTILDPGFTGILLVMGIIIILNYQFKIFNKFSKANFLSSYVIPFTSFTVCFIALLLTYSRASYLALVVGITVFALRTKKLLLLGLIPVFILAIFFLPRPGGEGVKLERTASITARVDSIGTAVSKPTMTNVLFGRGWYEKKAQEPTHDLGGFVVPNHSSAPENSAIFVYSSLGVVGLVLFGALLIASLFVLRFDPTYTAILSSVGVHSLFSNTLFHPFVLLFMVMILAVRAHVILNQKNVK